MNELSPRPKDWRTHPHAQTDTPMQIVHVWRVRGQGQLVFTHVVTKRPLLSEVEPLLGWFKEDELPVVEVHYCGIATIEDQTDAR